CPANRVDSLGTTLYGRFRRRYGLQRTTEERVAGLLGAVVEYAPASALLRLFARILGAPPNAHNQGDKWPFQTVSEDANRGLEPELAGLVTTARHWLATRGFLAVETPLVGVGDGRGGSGRGDDGGVGVGWRKAIVVRTHAAMCASVLLKPGWGSGHQIMGAAEQAILELPTVVGEPGLGGNRWTGQRWQQPWSESVDAEAFLEVLLHVVLWARELCSAAYAGLFGPKAIAGHPFLLAKARDINAPAAADAKEAVHGPRKTDTERGLESLLEAVSKSPLSKLHPTAPTPAVPAEAAMIPTDQEYGRRPSVVTEEVDADFGGVSRWGREGQQGGGDSSRPDAHVDAGEAVRTCVTNNGGDGDGNTTLPPGGVGEAKRVRHECWPELCEFVVGPSSCIRFRRRAGELGEEGDVLKRLRPILDSFIREDTQRTGTVPAAVFRRVMCEGHGGLWPNLPTPARAGSDVAIPEGGAAEFVDPRLTFAENDAARTLVRRFVDAFDGQVCYLDVWITLYHAVFRSGKIVPFTELPSICENQLRGADTEHWEALLEYFETAAAEIGSTSTAAGFDKKKQPGMRQRELLDTRGSLLEHGQRSCSALQGSDEASNHERGGARGGTAAKPLARRSSMPTLGLLRTSTSGGAASSFYTSGATATTATSALQRPPSSSPLAKTSLATPAATTPTPGVAAEWPRAGWGPGSLTVSRPPRAPAASEMVVSASAMIAALRTPLDHLGQEGARMGVSRGESFDCGGDGVCASGGGVSEGIVGGGGNIAAATAKAADGCGRTAPAEKHSNAGRGGDRCVGGKEGRPSERREQHGHASCCSGIGRSVAEGDDISSRTVPHATEDLVGSVLTGMDAVEHGDGLMTDYGCGARAETDTFSPYSFTGVGEGGGHNGTSDTGTQGQDQQQQRQRQREAEDEAGLSEHPTTTNDPTDAGAEGQRQPGMLCSSIHEKSLHGIARILLKRRSNHGIIFQRTTSRQATAATYEGTGEEPRASSSLFDEEYSLSGGMLVYNLDSGTLEPPSPEPPSPERQGGHAMYSISLQQQQSSRRKKRREKRVMTSVYVRCPFLDPVKSKHAYKIPRGGRSHVPSTPVFYEAADASSVAAQLYSSIASSKAKKAAAAAAAAAADASGRRVPASRGKRRQVAKSSTMDTGKPMMLQVPPSLKETMLREGRSKSRERRRAEDGTFPPGPGGGGGR
ncbi:unnamed protein product, partial [Hapterophycus canaliculatus]